MKNNSMKWLEEKKHCCAMTRNNAQIVHGTQQAASNQNSCEKKRLFSS